MAKKTDKDAEEVIKDSELVSESAEEVLGEHMEQARLARELPAGIVKEYTQNGMRYRRIRHEGGRIEDVRI